MHNSPSGPNRNANWFGPDPLPLKDTLITDTEERLGRTGRDRVWKPASPAGARENQPSTGSVSEKPDVGILGHS